MDRSPPVPETDALLEHTVFVRQIAQRILHDEAKAEDVVQATFLRALERPRKWRNLRAWLGTVARNLAISVWRADRSRAKREQTVARREDLPSADEAVVQLELQQKVVQAVLTLEEPYRSVVVHRFFYDLSSREIARRLDVPYEAVRTRLRRGVAQLRTRLEEHYDGNRKALLIALLPLAYPRPAAAAVAATTTTSAAATTAVAGGLAMKLKFATVAVLIAGAALLTWGLGFRTQRETAERSTREVASTPSVADEDATPEPVTATPPEDAIEVRGRVIDAEGDAVPGAKVVAAEANSPPEATEFWETVARTATPPQPVATAQAGDAGAFALHVPRDARVVLMAADAGRVSAPLRQTDLGDGVRGLILRLLPAGEVHGKVIDETDRSVLEADVRFVDLSPEPLFLANHVARTDRSGLFLLRQLPPGGGAVLVSRAGFVTRFVGVTLPARPVTIRLRRGRRLEGVVRAHASHEPVAGAAVTIMANERSIAGQVARTDVEGRFVFEAAPRYPVHLMVNAEERGSAYVAPKDTVGREHFEITLDAVRTARGRVMLAGTKQGVPGIDLVIHEQGVFINGKVAVQQYVRGIQQLRSGEDGRFEVHGVSGNYASIRVPPTHPEYGTRNQYVIPSEKQQQIDEIPVYVSPRYTASGVVRDEEERPIEGARVRIAGSRSVYTNAAGEFTLRGLIPIGGRVQAVATKPGYLRGRSLEFVAGGEQSGLDIPMKRTGVVVGRVVDEAGEGIAGAHVSGGQLDSTYSAADGAFRLETDTRRVVPIVATRDGYTSRAEEAPVGAPEPMTLVLRALDPAASLRGRVVDAAGAPVVGAFVTILGKAYVTTDLEGSFETPPVAAGKHRVRVGAPGFTAIMANDVAIPGTREFVLAAGQTISGRVLDYAGNPSGYVIVSALQEDGDGSSGVQSDARGAFKFDDLAPGRYRLMCEFQRGMWKQRAELRGVTTGSTDVVLRVPPPTEVSGRIVAPNGVPVKLVEVFAVAESENGQGGSGWTDENGAFKIQGLSGETFRITCNMNRSIRFPEKGRFENLLRSDGYALHQVAGVKAGATDVVLRYVEGREIAGVVYGIDGEPRAGATVNIVPDDKLATRGVVTTDEHGAFRLRGLAAGRYTVTSWASDGTRAELANQNAGAQGLQIRLQRKD